MNWLPFGALHYWSSYWIRKTCPNKRIHRRRALCCGIIDRPLAGFAGHEADYRRRPDRKRRRDAEVRDGRRFMDLRILLAAVAAAQGTWLELGNSPDSLCQTAGTKGCRWHPALPTNLNFRFAARLAANHAVQLFGVAIPQHDDLRRRTFDLALETGGLHMSRSILSFESVRNAGLALPGVIAGVYLRRQCVET